MYVCNLNGLICLFWDIIDGFSKTEDTTIHPSLMRESVADCFNVFEGILLYLDPRMRELLHDFQGRLDSFSGRPGR